MSKLKCVCGVALALAFSAAGCSDSDEPSTGDAGASSAGRAGSTGVAGKGGGSAQAGSTGEAGTNEPEGGAAGTTSAAGGSSGSDNDSNPEGGSLGIGDCLPDGTELEVTATGNSAYVISGLPEQWSDGEGDENAHLALCRSYTYTFVLNAAGHPFYFKTDASLGTADAYDTGVTNNGSATGTISWTLAGTAPGLLYYQCSLHQAMGGEITVVEPP